MKRKAGLGLIFLGLWSITYTLNPQASGTHARSLFSYGVLAALTTAGIGLVTSKREES